MKPCECGEELYPLDEFCPNCDACIEKIKWIDPRSNSVAAIIQIQDILISGKAALHGL